MMQELDCLWTLISVVARIFHVLMKTFFTAFSFKTPSPPSPVLSWNLLADALVPDLNKERHDSTIIDEDVTPKELILERVGVKKRPEESKDGEFFPVEERRVRKRPAKIVIPHSDVVGLEIDEVLGEELGKETEGEGNGYCVVSRRGDRHSMEDGFSVMTNIHGDSKKAFFGVFDGHGGKSAMVFVSEKLGQNIISALEGINAEEEDYNFESAIRAGYLKTDQEFLKQGLSSGTCAATVVLRNGKLHASNVGDCKVVMSRKGVTNVLTSDHRPGREDEMKRIENLGGFVNSHNGVWRVNGSLAISRAIGDASMKNWIISEPETQTICLNKDCDFLIMASDGLWDKVSNQEAVDEVTRHVNSMQSCKKLIEIALSRGNLDDITVMIVDLRSFFAAV